ncbi:MAG: hypothetical protein MZV65_52835 [Chromatiales bacterium]|nr:hypothetical protein [Chromatiales bacterium]
MSTSTTARHSAASPRGAAARGARCRQAKCGLGEVGRRLIGNLSKGYQQRVGIAQAIIHLPAGDHPRRADRRPRPDPDPRDPPPDPRPRPRPRRDPVHPHPARGADHLHAACRSSTRASWC